MIHSLENSKRNIKGNELFIYINDSFRDNRSFERL